MKNYFLAQVPLTLYFLTVYKVQGQNKFPATSK